MPAAGVDYRVCCRVFSNSLAILKEIFVGEHRLGRTIVLQARRRRSLGPAARCRRDALNTKRQVRTIASPVESTRVESALHEMRQTALRRAEPSAARRTPVAMLDSIEPYQRSRGGCKRQVMLSSLAGRPR